MFLVALSHFICAWKFKNVLLSDKILVVFQKDNMLFIFIKRIQDI